MYVTIVTVVVVGLLPLLLRSSRTVMLYFFGDAGYAPKRLTGWPGSMRQRVTRTGRHKPAELGIADFFVGKTSLLLCLQKRLLIRCDLARIPITPSCD